MVSRCVITVKAPPGSDCNRPEFLHRIDEHIRVYCARCKPDEQGVTTMNPDGSFDVVITDIPNVWLVRGILTTHYGLQVLREVTSGD